MALRHLTYFSPNFYMGSQKVRNLAYRISLTLWMPLTASRFGDGLESFKKGT